MEDQNNSGVPNPMSPPTQSAPQPTPQQPSIQPTPQPPSPTPGTPYNNSTPSKNQNIKIIIIIIAGLLVLGAAGFGVSKLLSKSSKSSSSSSGIDGLGGEKLTEKSGSVGSTVDLGHYEITVGNVTEKTSLGEYSEPTPGKKFILASIKIKNKYQEAIKNPDYYFTLTTESGEILNSLQPYDNAYKRMSDAIAPNGESEGYIYFEIVNSDKMKNITFEYKFIPTDVAKDIQIYKATFTE